MSKNKNIRVALCYPFFLIQIILFPLNSVNGQIPDAILKAQEATNQLKINESRKLIKNIEKSHFTILLDDYNDVIELIIDENPDLFDEYEERAEGRLKWIDENLDKKSPWKDLIKAEIKFHWGVTNFKYNNEITAVWQINQAHSLIKQNQKKFPKFTENLKTSGLFHIIIGALPNNYQWVLEKLGFKGDVNLGLKELEKCSETKNFFQYESKILNNYIKAHLFNDYENAIYQFENELGGIKNLTTNYILASLLSNTHQAEKALKVMNNRPTGEVYPNFDFYHYKLGNCYFQKGEFSKAISEFNLFLNNYKGKNYVKGAYHKLALSHYFVGNGRSQHAAFENINNKGWELLDEDKYAQNFYEEGKFPNKTLAKARYLSDGGYYKEALNQLHEGSNSIQTEEDNLELLYRFARIYDAQKSTTKALHYYHETIKFQDGNELNQLYYAPNSCLNAAILYLNQSDKEKAKELLKKAIAYKNHAYENSIEMKAKSLLNQLEK